MARESTKKECKPLVMLQGRILLRNRQGEVRDVTEYEYWGLKHFTEDGALVIDVLGQLRKRLDLLFLATEHRSQIDAAVVRLAVEDIRSDLEDGSDLHGYVHLTHEMFEHSEALPPLPTPDTRKTGRSLTIIKRA